MNLKKNPTVAIIGLGYVGLPLLHLLSRKNMSVLGFDIDSNKISKLKNNLSYISDLNNKDIKIINKKKLYKMKDLSKIRLADFIILCLPTPLTKNIKPDLSIIKNVFNKIKNFLKNDQTLILESTVYPGATNKIFYNFVNKNFCIGKNFFYGYSSERISPGQTGKNLFLKFENIPKVVSGFDKNSLKKISTFYKKVFKKVYPAQSIEVAEMSKLVENSYRSVNIGLVNELKIVCDILNINIHDVLSAAKTKPFGYISFFPGPGVGGHCIPIDPLFVTYAAKKKNYNFKFANLASKINLDITGWILNKIYKFEKGAYNKKNKKKILIIGISYKAEVNDTRDSPAVKIFQNFKNHNNYVDYYDPFVNKIKISNKYHYSKSIKKCENYDFVVICTDHSSLPLNLILNKSKKIFDTRGVFKNTKRTNVIHC